jgi:hypothetical protein
MLSTTRPCLGVGDTEPRIAAGKHPKPRQTAFDEIVDDDGDEILFLGLVAFLFQKQDKSFFEGPKREGVNPHIFMRRCCRLKRPHHTMIVLIAALPPSFFDLGQLFDLFEIPWSSVLQTPRDASIFRQGMAKV